jgi:arylsulfatase A-like enzyme
MNSKKPNILIFLMDSQGVDNISCYNYYKKTTPNIDRIAKDGVIFLNNFSPGVWTPPSHVSLFTGKYPSGHQFIFQGLTTGVIPEEIPTISEVLNVVGYKTAAFTRSVCVSPTLRGFKEITFPDILLKRKREKNVLIEDNTDSLYTIELAKNWIEKNCEKAPFFVFLNVNDTHHPYWANEPFRSKFLPKEVCEERAKKVPQQNDYSAWRKEYPWQDDEEVGYPQNPKDWMIMKALYDGETAKADHRLGILIDYLHEKKLYDNTMIIVTSDHHDVTWEHPIKYSGHTSLYDANLHIPLIVKGYSEDFPPGTVINNLTDLTDIYPTFIEILKIKEEKFKRNLQGYSLLATLTENPPRKYVLAEMGNENWYYTSWSKSLRNSEYKYIWHSNKEDELYDITKDPYEQKNLISEMAKKGKEIQKELEKILLSFHVPPVHLKREAVKWLIAWGYHRQIIAKD